MSLLGIDVGTSGCKVALFSLKGEILASAYREYTATSPQAGWAELDAAAVWEDIQACIRAVMAERPEAPVQAVSVSSLAESVVPVSADRRIQAANELTSATPIFDVFGTGDVYIFPGGTVFFSGTAPAQPFPNRFFIAGAGTQQENGIGAFRTVGGWIPTNTVTLIGDATIGGGGGTAGAIAGKITGPFNLSLCSSATVNGSVSISNPANDWTGTTTLSARLSGGTTPHINTFISGASDVIPNGFGKGNVVMAGGNSRNITWNLNGFNETINGLGNTGPGESAIINNGGATPSTLTVGDNDQSGTFGGTLQDGSAVFLPDVGVHQLAVKARKHVERHEADANHQGRVRDVESGPLVPADVPHDEVGHLAEVDAVDEAVEARGLGIHRQLRLTREPSRQCGKLGGRLDIAVRGAAREDAGHRRVEGRPEWAAHATPTVASYAPIHQEPTSICR